MSFHTGKIFVALIFLSICGIIFPYSLISQTNLFKNSKSQKPDSILKDTENKKQFKDTLQKSKYLDSINILYTEKVDSLNKLVDTTKRKTSSIDTTVIYSAKDSVIFQIKNKTMRLRGESKLELKQQKLESEIIELDFNKSLLKAFPTTDSSAKNKGYPKFTDKGENFVGSAIEYNFKTKQGLISAGETEVSQGFYYGQDIKRISESELFIKNGCYTTCDAPHPHYYFGSPEMKFIANDRVFLDPLYFYVEDMPVFIIPFGLFFPNKGGRQSGLMVPSFFFSKDRGVVFQDFGYYFALSDYYDTQIKMDFFSKGGYTLKNLTRWKQLNEFDGNINLEYGRIRLNPDANYTETYKFFLAHNQSLTPQSKLVANVSFMSQNNYINTSTDPNLRLTQNVTSNAMYSRSFDNGSSVSVALLGEQNIINKTYNFTFPQLNYSLPQWKPLKSFVPSDSWLNDISISYNVSGSYYTQHALQYTTTYIAKDSTITDTSFQNSYRAVISHSPSISISPKFGYFTVSPSISLRANNYFRRLTRAYNPIDSTTVDSYERGLYTEYKYSMGVNVQTRLYGIIKPKLFGINAVRHTFQPSIGISYTPDQSNPVLGFYDKYFDTKQNQWIIYSRYESDGGNLASRYLSKSLNFNFLNSFDTKIAQKDTLPDLNVKFLDWRIGGSYNFAADSLKFSDIAMNFSIPDLKIVSLTSNANFTVYNQERVYDSTNHQYNFVTINQYLWSTEKRLMRLKAFDMTLTTSFSSEGVSIGTPSQPEETVKKDSIGLGERFQQRRDYTEAPFDSFGDSSPGYSPLNLPWQLSFNIRYQYQAPNFSTIPSTLNIGANFSLKLTPTWNIDGSAQYDFVNRKLFIPAINIHKNLHCWDLSLSWYPEGRGFYLRFGILAPQLHDLKLEKRASQIYGN